VNNHRKLGGSNDLLIETLKLKQLVSASKTGVVVSTLLALILAYVQQGLIPHQVILTWLVAVLLVNIIRFAWSITTQEKVNHITHTSQLLPLFKQFRLGI